MKRWIAGLLAVLSLGAASLVAAPAAHASLGSNIWAFYYSYVNGPNSAPVTGHVATNRVPQWQVGTAPGVRLTFQNADANGVEYANICPNSVCWASNTAGIPRVASWNWQSDGNSCIYDANGRARWCTNTWTTAHLPYYMALWSGGCLEVQAALSAWHRVWSNGRC